MGGGTVLTGDTADTVGDGGALTGPVLTTPGLVAAITGALFAWLERSCTSCVDNRSDHVFRIDRKSVALCR